MGFFSEDMVPMLGVYEAETSELVATIDGIVSRAEREKGFSDEDVAELFRCAHTIKGSSAMMGLDSIASLTHKVEDLFDLMRGDPTVADGRVPDILDHLYDFSDFVKDELERMSADDYVPGDADELIRAVSAEVTVLEGGAGFQDEADTQAEASAALPPTEAGGAEEGEAIASEEAGEDGADGAGGEDGAVLKVTFKPDIPMVNARAMVILKQLAKQAPVKSHVPEDLTDVAAAKAIADDGLLLVVDQEDVDKAKQLLAKNSAVMRIAVLDNALAAPSETAGQGRGADTAPTQEKFVTLRWSSVHDLQNMAGEFMLQTARLKALCNEAPDENQLRATVSQAARLVDDLVYAINKMSMVSVSAMIPQLSRMVRDMCRNSGKQVSFEVHGGDIEIDRNLYNSISDPLLHIIRNAVDHGIEAPEDRLAAGKEARGKVTLTIENLGARVAFRVADDGKGIDTAKVLAKAEANGKLEKPASQYSRQEILHMVMMAGLSTTDEVTQYSGRGVGMDVVSAVVRDFNGHFEIESEAGAGTAMTLYMPVSVTAVKSLVFRIGPSLYHMPLLNLNKIYVAGEAKEHIEQFDGSYLFTYEKRQIPVLDMHGVLGCEGADAFYIVCHSMSDEFVMGVDEVVGEFECANKPLPSCLGREWRNSNPIRNVAILDDGSVGYALHTAFLASLAQGKDHVEWDEADADAGNLQNAAEGQLRSEIPPSAFVFTLGDEVCAIPVDVVERLVPLPAYAVTPKGLPFLMGLSTYHNQVYGLFDLARSAGVGDPSPYALIVRDEFDELRGLAITSAVGVRDLDGAVMAEEQPESRSLAAGLRTSLSIVVEPKEPPVTLLAFGNAST